MPEAPGRTFFFNDAYEDFAGVTINGITHTYFVSENNQDKLFEIRRDGTLIREIDIGQLKRPGILTADVEGLAWLGGNSYALALHDGEELAVVNITSATTALARADAAIYDISGPGKPKGLAYAANENALYWVGKDEPKQIGKGRFNPATGQFDKIWVKDVDELPVADLADVAFFPRLTPHLVLLSETSRAVLEVEVTGPSAVVKSSFSLTAWDIPKAGGIVFNQDGEMVIVGKHEAGTPEDDYNVFTPTGPIANQPPIADAGDPLVFVMDADGDGAEAATIPGASSRDDDGMVVDYRWFVNGAPVAEGFGPGVAPLSYTFALGASTVSLRVRDDAHAMAEASVIVTVLPPSGNRPPLALARVPDAAAAIAGLGAHLPVNAEESADPDGDPIHRYLWTEGAATLYDGASATATLVLAGLGPHTVTLTVFSTDGQQITQSGSKDFEVDVVQIAGDPAIIASRKWIRVVGTDFSFGDDNGDFAGATYNSETDTYFFTDNKSDKIFETTSGGVLLRTIDIRDMRKPGELETDAEGITWISGTRFAIVSEGAEELLIFDIFSGTTEINRGQAQVHKLFGDPKGVVYVAAQDAFYWVSQGEPKRVVKSRLNAQSSVLENVFIRDLSGLPVADLADIAYAPDISPYFFLISQATPAVLEVDVESSTPVIASRFLLNPWPIPKPGGLVFTPQGRMIIVGKREPGLSEDDFNVFAPVDDDVANNFPNHPDGAPPISLNYIHPGSSVQQAEFFVDLKEQGAGEIRIFDQIGREVHTIRTPDLPAGRYRAIWDLKNGDGRSVASGLYFVMIKTPDNVRKERLVVVR